MSAGMHLAGMLGGELQPRHFGGADGVNIRAEGDGSGGMFRIEHRFDTGIRKLLNTIGRKTRKVIYQIRLGLAFLKPGLRDAVQFPAHTHAFFKKRSHDRVDLHNDSSVSA